MRLATFTLALALLLATAAEAPAQRVRFVGWQTGTTTFSPRVWYTSPYGYQNPWSYMPYGYGAPYGYGMPHGYGMPYGYGTPVGYGGLGYPWGGTIGVQYGYLPYNYAAPREDYGPPARARASLYPAIPYSEFAAQEQQRTSDSRGYINVRVPADAKVWINDQLMTQGGRDRSFQTPILASAAKQYSFEIKASWTDDLGPRTQQINVQVRAGETRDATFPLPKN